MGQKKVLCSSCDIYCQVLAEKSDNGSILIKAQDPRPGRANICMKGVHAPEGFDHPDRIRRPRKRVGPRGSGNWQTISWDDALDEIADKLKKIISNYGPESLAVSESPWNIQTDNGMTRRFMNLVGSPNWLSGVSLCAGNTAAINRMVYGWLYQDQLHSTIRAQSLEAQLDARLQFDPAGAVARSQINRTRSPAQ